MLSVDSYLRPFAGVIKRRIEYRRQMEEKLTCGRMPLADFASGHEYFGLHFRDREWVFREWAPNATAVYLIGDLTGWLEDNRFALEKISEDGVWEIRFPVHKMGHQDFYRLRVHWPGGSGDRIPAYARRVVQDPVTQIFNAQVWHPPTPYQWENPVCKGVPESLLIYEAHVGMAQEEQKIGSYDEFTRHILPRIIDAGYNTIQLMAICEHPYYGSFGYHVSSFFAASSRFGTPDQLKRLIDTAHGSGLRVVMDIVHSHAVLNEVEGLSCFDGTPYQYFHEGPRGIHEAWGSRCFDYAKPQVLHFLLSNCRFWLDEYRFDGFRFDGITSMLYYHHGLGEAFTSYDQYFSDNVDEDALAYLALANKVIHDVRPDAIAIAEDISGMPGLAMHQSSGGTGFDYRFAMGIADYWIKLVKDMQDEHWQMGSLWFELTNRRREEKTISYAECHDQALVGDKTLIFRLIDSGMYHDMHVSTKNIQVGSGYLNFMGNEFGHPEWIDFPREGNNWSYYYARRQWHLVDDSSLKFGFLARFDKDMIRLIKQYQILRFSGMKLLHEHSQDKVIAFERGGLIFVFNFHPSLSHVDYRMEVPSGKYQMVFQSDSPEYGGHDRLEIDQYHDTIAYQAWGHSRFMLSLYLPTRTAIVLKPVSPLQR